MGECTQPAFPDRVSTRGSEMQANSAQRWQCAGHAADMSSDSNFHRQPLPCIAQRALDLLATGVIVTDEGRSVVEMNQAAEAIVASALLLEEFVVVLDLLSRAALFGNGLRQLGGGHDG